MEAAPRPAHELRWHVPPHVVMVAVMVAVMLPGAGAASHLLGAGVLVVLGLVLAPLARRRRTLHPVLLDLGIMVAVLAAAALAHPAAGGHGHGVAGFDGGLGWFLAVGVAVLAWLPARLIVTRGRVSAVTGVLSGAGVVLMALG